MVEPEFDFLVTSLLFGRHLEDVDFDFFAVIEIFDDGIGEFRESARANVTTDVFIIFVHKEKDISAFKILEKRDIDVGKVFGIVTFGRYGARIINNFITATFEITSPVSGTFLEFGTSCDDKFFHDLVYPCEFRVNLLPVGQFNRLIFNYFYTLYNRFSILARV